ncbi:YfhO family protein, partial [bacterium]|nr:YfhO family protein [bacterium]MBU1024941.1 YfhO family protein [bacterium]
MKKAQDIIAIGILLLVIIIRFSPFIFMGVPVNTDSWKNYYPWRADFQPDEIKTINYDSNMLYGTLYPMVKQEISDGRFPHWNQYSGCGVPWYPDHLIPVFHIPFALALLFPGDLVLAAYTFLMCVIGTLFFYWFLRNWNFSVFVSLFGGLALFLSGWQMYLYPPEVASLIWIPAILLFHDRFLKSNRMSDACWATFFIGQLLIGGYPVMITHFFYFVLAYFIWRRFHRDFSWNTSVRKWIAALIMMAVFGMLISAVQNYPTWKFMLLTNRDITSEGKNFQTPDEILETKKELLQSERIIGTKDFGKLGVVLNLIRRKTVILIPTFNVDFNESRTFAGVVVVFLALLGLFVAPKRFNVIKIFFAVFGIFFLFGPIFLLIVRFIPGWSISALNPREVFFFLLFFMAVLGLDHAEKNTDISQPVRIFSVAYFIMTALLIYLHPAVTQPVNADFHWKAFTDVIWVAGVIALSIIVLIPLVIKMSGMKLPGNLYYCSLAGFTIVGLVAHCYLYPYFASKELMPENEKVKKIVNICKDARFTKCSNEIPQLSFTEKFTYILPPNTPSRFKMMDSLNYDNMMLADMEEFLETAAPGSLKRQRGAFHILGNESLNPTGLFVQSTGTKYVMQKKSEEPFFSSIPVYDDSGILIFDMDDINTSGKLKNKNPYMKAVKKYEMTDKYTNDPLKDDFTSKILLEKIPSLKNGSVLESTLDPVELDIISYKKTSTQLSTEFEVSNDCIVYFADTFHPRWRVKIDGEEVELLKANYAFRAIAVSKGKHDVLMWYDGIEVLTGGLVSVVSLLLLVLIGIGDAGFR